MRLKDWNTPLINVVHGFLFLLDVSNGVSSLSHGRWKLGLIDFVLAGTRPGGLMDKNTQAYQLALANLERIAKLYGAVMMEQYVELVVDGLRFQVYPDNIYKISNERIVGTCYQSSRLMTPPEKIATAILLLHNDPTIFERWARQDGTFYS